MIGMFQEKCDTFAVVTEARKLDPRSQKKENLLHMAVTNNTAIPTQGLIDDDQGDMFPSEAVVKFMLECGYDVNVNNEEGETPLHVAAKKVRKKIPYTADLFGKVLSVNFKLGF